MGEFRRCPLCKSSNVATMCKSCKHNMEEIARLGDKVAEMEETIKKMEKGYFPFYGM